MSTIESTILRPQAAALSLQQGKLIRQALMINVFIIISIIASSYSTMPAFIGGILIVLYLSTRALISPVKTFFIVFGIKLTFDALWFVRLPGFEDYGLLHLFLIPVFVLVFFGPKTARHGPRWPISYAFIYLLWVSLTMVTNNVKFDPELLFRQSGIIIGLLVGYRYLRDTEDFNLLAYLIFISTIVPALASLAQILMGPDVAIFHYKFDTIREYRYSGLYYDPATTGMVNVLSLGSNLYLLYVGAVKERYRKYHYAFIPLSFLVILSGGTRSIIFTASFILAIFLIRNVRKTFVIIPLLLIVFFLSQSYIDKVVERSAYDVKRPVQLNQILQETEYRTMFTGRIGLWQDIWERVKSGTPFQQLFGSGLSSNAHSSYFFLLLQIGWLGLISYVLSHIFLFMGLLYRNIPKTQKLLALLSLSSILMVGFSASTVAYTSFQWIIYLIVGGVLNMEINRQRADIEGSRKPIRW